MKKIYCKKCGIHLGDIEKGKLRKDIVYLCPKCWNVIYQDNPILDNFSKIFK